MRKIGFVEGRQQDTVQLLRRGQVAAERLFDDDAGARRRSPTCQLLDDRAEQHRRNGEVVRRCCAEPSCLRIA